MRNAAIEKVTGLKVQFWVDPSTDECCLVGYVGDTAVVSAGHRQIKEAERRFLALNLDRIRLELMEEQNGRCARCKRAVPLSLHHIKHRSKERDDRHSNLWLLCGDCHRGAHGEKSV